MASDIWMIGHEVELPEMLDGRERRAKMQEVLRQRYHLPIVCFTLNVAGPIKVFALSEEVFEQAEERIRTVLWKNGLFVRELKEERCSCGWEAYFVVNGDPVAIKQALLPVEEEDPAGRLYDIDVLRPDGTKVSREELALPERPCLICGAPAKACARSRTHTVKELQDRTADLMIRSLRRQRMSSYMIGRLCRQAMLLEVYTTPKPGLVDRVNNGAHRDMNVALFERSTAALEPYFVEFAMTGRELYEESPESILRCIRPIGIRAEEAMLAATYGVNTHKGMIFSLGILATATGYCIARAGRSPVSLEGILHAASMIAAPAWRDDFRYLALDAWHVPTAGEQQYRKYGIGGIRKEAAEGFPSVVRFAWPILSAALDEGVDYNEAGALALLNLIAHVTDTNMIKRSSVEEQQRLQQKVQDLLAQPEGVRKSQVVELDEEFIRLGVSPGGCADLLALTFYLYEISYLL